MPELRNICCNPYRTNVDSLNFSLATEDRVSQMDAVFDSSMLAAICLEGLMAGLQLDAFPMPRAESRFWKPLLIAWIMNVLKTLNQKRLLFPACNFRPE